MEFPNTLDLKPYTIQDITRREKIRSDSAQKSAEGASPEGPGPMNVEEEEVKVEEEMLDETPEERESRLYTEEVMNYQEECYTYKLVGVVIHTGFA